jgi:hypothetical protein
MRPLSALLGVGFLVAIAFAQSSVQVPRIWDDAALSDWATPLAGLNVRPGHFSSEEYYRVPADNLRTYPVYPPDREPPGYWEWLQAQKPQPLVDASRIETNDDWIAAGRRAFFELDAVLARTNDPSAIARARDQGSFRGVYTLADGSVLDPRWVVTGEGVMLTMSDCTNCHMRVRAEGDPLFGGPLAAWPMDMPIPRPPGLPVFEFFERAFSAQFPGEQFGAAFWRTTAVPWLPEERVDRLREMTSVTEMGALFGGNTGTVPRTNGSPFYGAKVPDLHVLRYARYLDATGTHRLRGPEDVARYIALVTAADPMEFGPHRMLRPEQRRVSYRFADEVLYAIAMYLLALEPPANPNAPVEALQAEGERIFRAVGCAGCHTPPGYTSGMLTPAEGYDAPPDHPNMADVLPISAETDSGLAMRTRKGTGFYKVPSLRGLWYRPFLLHDGSVASLEELFNPERLNPSHVPGGWKAPGVERGAITGHRYGLELSPEEKEALLAFLKSL